jgi:hypothetical protein
MKKLVGLSIMMLFSTLMITAVYTQTKQNSSDSKTKLEVIYFHATMRCPTCNAVEDNARKLLEKSYKSQLGNGTIKFNSYNVDESANKALMEKYQISFSTLLLVSADGSKTDFTAKAFQYALTNPSKYESLLNEAIQAKLK